ncbi:MAG: hypothetical protein AAF986_03480 [Pseudomonadota bacterium]
MSIAYPSPLHRAGFRAPAPVESALGSIVALGLLLAMAAMTGLALVASAVLLPVGLLFTWVIGRRKASQGARRNRRPGWQAVTA